MAEAGRSTTSPAAIWLIAVSFNCLITGWNWLMLGLDLSMLQNIACSHPILLLFVEAFWLTHNHKMQSLWL